MPEEYYLNDVSLAPDGSLFTTHMHSKTISILEFLFKSITKGKTGFAMRWDKEFGFSEISNSQEVSQMELFMITQQTFCIYL